MDSFIEHYVVMSANTILESDLPSKRLPIKMSPLPILWLFVSPIYFGLPECRRMEYLLILTLN
jgi:hypothetical protein